MASNKPEPVERNLVYQKLIGETGVWTAEADGSKPRLLVPNGERPVISPDGKWVAYASGERSYLVPTSGGEPSPIPEAVGGITWSPDSERIIAAGNGGTLVSIDVPDGKQVTLIAHGGMSGDIRHWSISPDGSQIVFAVAQSQGDEGIDAEKVDLFVAPSDGGDAKQITYDGDSDFPVWGPKSIAFAKLIPSKYPNANNEFARNEVWRIQPDGTGRTRISSPLPERLAKGYWHCIGLEPIDWSDDGSALLAAMDCEAIGESVAVDPQTGALRSLGEGTFTVALSQDAQFALVQWGDERVGHENERVLIYPYAGGKPKVVARGATAPSWNR